MKYLLTSSRSFRWYTDSTCSTEVGIEQWDQSFFKCSSILSYDSASYASFKCNSDGTSTVTPYVDTSCILPSGSPFTINPTSCNVVVGSPIPKYFTTACSPPPAYALTGYFKQTLCAMTDDFFLYPLGTCTSFIGSTTGGVVFSTKSTATEIHLNYKYFQLSDCSDIGSPLQLAFTHNKTCSSGTFMKGSLIGTTLPTLVENHQSISFYPDNNCKGNVQQVYHMRDGCAPVPGGFAKIKCKADGSSLVQLFASNDFSCSQTPVSAQITVQPSVCSELEGAYFTATCVP